MNLMSEYVRPVFIGAALCEDTRLSRALPDPAPAANLKDPVKIQEDIRKRIVQRESFLSRSVLTGAVTELVLDVSPEGEPGSVWKLLEPDLSEDGQKYGLSRFSETAHRDLAEFLRGMARASYDSTFVLTGINVSLVMRILASQLASFGHHVDPRLMWSEELRFDPLSKLWRETLEGKFLDYSFLLRRFALTDASVSIASDYQPNQDALADWRLASELTVRYGMSARLVGVYEPAGKRSSVKYVEPEGSDDEAGAEAALADLAG
jgi:hypothetical protein